MTVEHWQAVSAVFALLFVVYYGQSRYWKSRAITMDQERDNDGWINEAKNDSAI